MLNLIKRFGNKDKAKQPDTTAYNNLLDDEKSVDRNTMRQEDIPEKEEYEIVEREILPEKIICPDCGGITLQGLDFCDKCGGELQ